MSNKTPVKTTLQKGIEYYWCACGLAKNGTFCDGSHATTDIRPMKFAAKETTEAYICTCKKSKNAPYCDGSHK